MSKRKTWQVVSLLFFLWGCGGGGSDSSSFSGVGEDGGKKTLEASLEVAPKKNWKSAKDSVLRWLEAAGGKLLELEVEESRVQLRARMPVNRADAFFARVRSLGLVVREYTALADITRQYADVEARLASKEAAVTRLQGLLAQARTPSEVLEAEKALQEALEARDELRSQFDNARLLSQTVTAHITLRNPATLPYGEGGSYWYQLLQSVEAGWTGFVYFTFAVAYLWWLWLLIGLLVGLFVWRRKRRGKAAQDSGKTST